MSDNSNEDGPTGGRAKRPIFTHPDELPNLSTVIREYQKHQPAKLKLSTDRIKAIVEKFGPQHPIWKESNASTRDWCTFCDANRDICQPCDAADCFTCDHPNDVEGGCSSYHEC